MSRGFLIVTMVCMFVVGCEENSLVFTEVPLNQEFPLGVGQRATVRGENLTVIFRNVTEDSRCPEDAQCIWEGNGKITLELKKPGLSFLSSELNTTLEPKKITYSEYEVHLKNLAPYPKLGTDIDPREYVAILIVKRAEETRK